MNELKTFLGFEEALEVTIISVSMVCITLIFLLNVVPQDLRLTFFLCSAESILFFALEKNKYVKNEVLKMFLISLFYLGFSLTIKITINLNEVVYISYIVLMLILSRNSFYLAFPSVSNKLNVVKHGLQLKTKRFLISIRSAYLRIQKVLLQRKMSEREALKLSRNILVNYLRNEKSLKTLSENVKSISVYTLAKDKDSFTFLFKEENLEFMIMVNRTSKKVTGPLFIPSIEQLSYALSKHFGLELKVVNRKPISFGILTLGVDNDKGVYYESILNLVNRKLKIKRAFLSYKFFLSNYEQNLILEDIKRIDNFKFEVIYNDGKRKYIDFVDTSNMHIAIKKKN
ncbi:MAG: hypothetical protein QW314_05335 [Thermoproteota archaeon]|nr:hypothetical protein [Candidatus Brockarchaeota archaeon]